MRGRLRLYTSWQVIVSLFPFTQPETGIVGFASPIVYAAGPYYKSKFKTATTASLSSSVSSSRSPTSHTVHTHP